MSRFGKPEELVETMVDFVHPRAGGFVTETDLPVDGEFLAQTF